MPCFDTALECSLVHNKYIYYILLLFFVRHVRALLRGINNLVFGQVYLRVYMCMRCHLMTVYRPKYNIIYIYIYIYIYMYRNAEVK